MVVFCLYCRALLIYGRITRMHLPLTVSGITVGPSEEEITVTALAKGYYRDREYETSFLLTRTRAQLERMKTWPCHIYLFGWTIYPDHPAYNTTDYLGWAFDCVVLLCVIYECFSCWYCCLGWWRRRKRTQAIYAYARVYLAAQECFRIPLVMGDVSNPAAGLLLSSRREEQSDIESVHALVHQGRQRKTHLGTTDGALSEGSCNNSYLSDESNVDHILFHQSPDLSLINS